MNLRLPSLDPIRLATWWPEAEAVLARRERGIASTAETYAYRARLTERETPVLAHSRWGYRKPGGEPK